jgi:hypothetical protein
MQHVSGAVEPKTHARDRHPETVAGTGKGALDIRHQPVELDRALHQAPNPEAGNQDQHADDRAKPDQGMVGVLADAPCGSAAGGPACGLPAMAIQPGVELGCAGSRRRRVAAQAIGPSDDAAE